MPKSHSPRNDRSGAKSNFKSNDRSAGKDKPFKKSYDGRSAGGSSQGDRPFKSSKPYSGRSAEGDGAGKERPERKSYGKPSFDRDSKPGGRSEGGFKPRREGDAGGYERKPRRDDDKGSFDRKPRKEYDKPRSEGDRGGYERKPRRDDDKGGFERKPRRDSDAGGFDRKPRKEYDKPRSDGDRGGYERKPRRDDDKGGFDRKPRRSEDGASFERKPRKEFDKPRGAGGERKPYGDRPRSGDGERKPFGDRPRRSEDGAGGERKPYGDKPRGAGGERKPYGDKPRRKFEGDRDDKPKRKYNAERTDGSKPRRDEEGGEGKREDTRKFRDRPDPFKDGPERKKEPIVISFSKDIDDDTNAEPKPFKAKRFAVPKREEVEAPKPVTPKGRKKKYSEEDEEDEEAASAQKEMPLNKYIAHSGECSRRDAADMVKQGKVKVNGELALDPGYRVQDTDQVTLSGKKLTPRKALVYILLNKPKGFITTNDDPQGRKTVMDLVANSGEERMYPVGRLDKDTTGLLLLTNDGTLTQKLSHPSYNIKKVYHVTLDKPMTKADFEKVVAGVELEDGIAIVDEIAYLEAKNELGLEIHSGRNRIVRRIFESLGYVVEKLDRMMYAGLTKKNLPRSKWRYLNEREIVLLKHFKQ